MPISYSRDLRCRVITACVAKEGSQRQLAQRFKVSLSFVRNLLRHYRTNGQIEAKRRGGYLKPLIQDEHLITQVAGYQPVGALHLNSRAIVHNEVCGCASRNRHLNELKNT
ncbi:MAG: hypothetical protein KME46_34895, partial [Brasilonema angustatum HA4187-MV1]|nr:hypothetical protein [Brasilonema angustatum HA4187-MV1]